MHTENKRIARNSLFLYFRTFLIMIVSLYTVRVTLQVLGYVDYGIYNAVAGIVSIFTFVNITLTSVSQRFLSFSLGKNDSLLLKQYFSSLFILFAIVAGIVAVLGDPIGVWYIRNGMTISSDKIEVAIWVYHFSIVTMVANIISIPYSSVIISHEKMDFYAYISIGEALMKLLIVYLLLTVDFNHLFVYAGLLWVVSLIKLICFIVFCHHKFEECRLMLYWNNNIYRQLLGYLGWNTLGVSFNVLRLQGIVLILNSFFGPVINAAYAVANQVSVAANQFINSFLLAVQPQIVKKYAEDQQNRMLQLVCTSSKFSFFLMMLVIIPCFAEIHMILSMWLGEYPSETIVFTRLLLLTALIDTISIPLVTAIQATGKIKGYNISISCILLLSIPIMILIAHLGYGASGVLYISLTAAVIIQTVRVYYIVRLTDMTFKNYFKNVISKVIKVIVLASLFPYILTIVMNDSIIRLIIISIVSILSSMVAIYTVGLQNNERVMTCTLIKRFMYKLKRA